jgi:ornithine cyclodeaminase/alanine dehydrogenase-like protein (mu-crystallin family)
MGSLSLPMIDEKTVATLVSAEDALREMRELFAKLSESKAVNFPVVRESVGASVFGVKSGSYLERGLLGLKAGGYFPANALKGNTRHQSIVVLFDAETGMPTALVGGNLITKLRTAAAAALSIELLAKPDASVLAVIGAGAQAESHIRAACAVRGFTSVMLWNRSPDAAKRLAQDLDKSGIAARVAQSAQAAVEAGDVVITLTPATSPVVRQEWVAAGTHLACMGADTAGKQEVDDGLVAASRVFTDSIEQACSIGECQAGIRRATFGREHIAGVLGDILTARCEGRRSAAEITLFDGTGLAVQDLVMADSVAKRFAALRPG